MNCVLRSLLLIAGIAPSASADFLNGGFENGDFTAWTLEYGTLTFAFPCGTAVMWSSTPPLGHPAPLVFEANDSPAAGQPIDIDPYNGFFAARINDVDGNFHATRLRQQVLVSSTEAACGELDVSFVYGAMLQNGHVCADDNSAFTIELLVNGVATFSSRIDAQSAAMPPTSWTQVAVDKWYHTFEQHLTIPAQAAGTPIELILTAYDCSGGLHGGMALLDYAKIECKPVQPICTGGTPFPPSTPCPCGNTGAPGHGCGHSFDLSGAKLTATGAPTSDDVGLASEFEPASAFTLFLQHSLAGDQVFHDGVLCASGSLIRLRGRVAVAGTVRFPDSNFANDATLTLSVRGGVAPGLGVRRYYSAWYRNASTTFCPPATANVTNGIRIDW